VDARGELDLMYKVNPDARAKATSDARYRTWNTDDDSNAWSR